ncbi:hypothetical protein PIB30_013061 [Stylosanthes scabra]|uniref:Uncharacterized protein n=1 Tax=Stylosanthes scabra TaxID=79078 RepID=A0ABU6T6M3_9FABA|nr:hypothetical protein [Stylosanthes scabra]
MAARILSTPWIPWNLNRIPTNFPLHMQPPTHFNLHLRPCFPASSPLPHNDDLQPLLQILPSDLHHNLLNEPQRAQLLEVILDLGRLPEARYLGKEGGQYIRDSELGNCERAGICPTSCWRIWQGQ